MSQNKFLSVFIEKKESLIESTDWGTYKIYFKWPVFSLGREV